MILCLGSSLKVLRRYPWLWCMDRQAKQRPPLYIVNLQWTPKDSAATLKLNGRCDFVLNEVLKNLRMRLPEYTPYNDPLLSYATHLNEREEHTTSRRYSGFHIAALSSPVFRIHLQRWAAGRLVLYLMSTYTFELIVIIRISTISYYKKYGISTSGRQYLISHHN